MRFSTALGEVAMAFQHDEKINEPILKVSLANCPDTYKSELLSVIVG